MSDLSSPAPTLYGLVLAGGRSSRMQRDKAELSFHGRSQLEWTVALLEPHVQRVFVSVRPDQVDDPIRARFAQVVDERAGLGPIAGILAAQARYPRAAWLVLACDLPYVDQTTITHLIRARQPSKQATAYRSSYNGLPEPLCAIFEPSTREALLAYAGRGKDCPRKFLINSDIQLLDQPNPRALENVNTPAERDSAMTALSSKEASPGRPRASGRPEVALSMTSKRIKVQYYALLREQAGRSDETLLTSARTPRELYEELKARYPFSLAPEMLRVAVNAEFGEWGNPLADGDFVVFIPPVAGG